MAKKGINCDKVDIAIDDIEEEARLSDLEDQINQQDYFTNETSTENDERFQQAFKDTLDEIEKPKKKFTKGEDYYFTEKKMEKLISKHYQGSERERQMIVMKLYAMSEADPDIGYIIRKEANLLALNVVNEPLQNIGRPLEFNRVTKNYKLGSLPLEILRVLVNRALEMEGYEFNGSIAGRFKRKVMFEFNFPITIAKKIGSAPLYKYATYQKNWKNYGNSFKQEVSNPNPNIAVNPKFERRHPNTNLPLIENLSRNKAGFNEVIEYISLNFVNKMRSNTYNKKPYFRDAEEGFEAITDIMFGKAFIAVDEKNYGKVYMFDEKRPTSNKDGSLKRYENGDAVLSWQQFERSEDKQELLDKKFKKKDKKISNKYVKPYMTQTGLHLDFNQPAENNNRKTNLVNILDSLTIHLDVLFDEVYRNVKSRTESQSKRMIDAIMEGAKNGIELPGMFQEMQADINGILSENDQKRKMMKAAQQKIRQKQVKQQWDRYYTEDGDQILGLVVERYYPTMYENFETPVLMQDKWKSLRAEISNLKGNEEVLDINSDKRKAIFRRRNELEKAFLGIEDSLQKFLEYDDIYKDEILQFNNPFSKHFKKNRELFPYDARRKDSRVIPDYINYLSYNFSKGNLLVTLAENIVQVKDPEIRQLMINKFETAVNYKDARGMMFGKEFSLPDLLSPMPNTLKQNVPKLINKFKQYSVVSGLSGWVQGLNQYVALVNKAMDVGFDRFMTAYNDLSQPYYQELLLRKGVYSFQDVFESHMLVFTTDMNREKYNALINKLEKNLKEAKSKGGEEAAKKQLYQNQQEYIYFARKMIDRIKETNHKSVMNDLAEFALTKKVNVFKDSGFVRKTLGAVSQNPILQKATIPGSEAVLRGTSFIIGAKQAVSHGVADSVEDPIAYQWGMQYINRTDFTLGAENLGMNYGNPLLQAMLSISVWKTQKNANEHTQLKNAFYSQIQYDPEVYKSNLKRKLAKGKAGVRFIKDVVEQLTYSGAGGAVGGMLLGAQQGGMKETAVGALLGGFASHGAGRAMGMKQRLKLKRITNPVSHGAIQEHLLHLGTASLYTTILFSDFGLTYLGIGKGVKELGKAFSYGTAGKMTSGAQGAMYPMYAVALMALYKALHDEGEFEDLYRIIFAVGGWGYALLANILMDIADGENAQLRMSKNYQQSKSNREKVTANTVVPKMASEPLRLFGVKPTDLYPKSDQIKNWAVKNGFLDQNYRLP